MNSVFPSLYFSERNFQSVHWLLASIIAANRSFQSCLYAAIIKCLSSWRASIRYAWNQSVCSFNSNPRSFDSWTILKCSFLNGNFNMAKQIFFFWLDYQINCIDSCFCAPQAWSLIFHRYCFAIFTHLGR